MHLKDERVHRRVETSKGVLLDIYWLRAGIPAVCLVEAYALSSPVPAGVVYYRFTQNQTRIDILDSRVRQEFKRQGIRTAINDTLRYWYPGMHIVSDHGTEEGTAFMKAYGYRQLKDESWFFQARRLKNVDDK